MHMTDEEIIREYQGAKNKKLQIGILADQNLVTKEEMKAHINKLLKKKTTGTMSEYLIKALEISYNAQIEEIEKIKKRIEKLTADKQEMEQTLEYTKAYLSNEGVEVEG